MRKLSLVVSAAAFLLVGVNVAIGAEPAAAWAPTDQPAKTPHQSAWPNGSRTRLAQQSQCACYTYNNSVCTGPCMPNGLPYGCLCKTH